MLEKTLITIDNIVKKRVSELGISVVSGVRVLSGQAKNSINLSLNNSDGSYQRSPLKYERFFTNIQDRKRIEFRAGMANYKAGDTIYISSGVPYIRVLEYDRGDLMFNSAVSGFGK